jgi:predicted PurR-regulated permease PerM
MNKKLIRDLTFLLLFIASFLLLKDSITPVILGLILSYLAGPLAKFFKRFMSSGLASLLSIVLVSSFLFHIFLTLPIFKDFITLQKKILQILNDSFGFYVNDNFLVIKKFLLTKLENNLQNLAQTLLNSTQSLMTLAINLLLAPFLAFYFLQEVYLQERKIPGNLGKLLSYFDQLAKNFCQIQISLALIYALIIMVFLSIIKLDNALGMGLLYGLGYLIPYLGFIFVTILVGLFTFLQYGMDYHLLAVLVFFITLNLLDSCFINPRFVASRFGLSPLTSLVFIIVIGKVLGLVGMIVALPIGVIVKDSITSLWALGENEEKL